MSDDSPPAVAEDVAVVEDRLFTTFDKFDEYLSVLNAFLSTDLFVTPTPLEQVKENQTLGKLRLILDEYQEQSYLLDPFLERIVGPPISALRSYAQQVAHTGNLGSQFRASALAKLVYWYTKTRGYKTIVRFFPHETSDFTLVLTLLTRRPSFVEQEWELCYVLLLWLSLICMLPFDLALFDEKRDGGRVVAQVEELARAQLGKPGKERQAAAVLLGKLYGRRDASSKMAPFVSWARERAVDPHASLYQVLGKLEVIAELLKVVPVATLSPHLAVLRDIAVSVPGVTSLSSSAVIRKMCSKIEGRIAVLELPAAPGRKSALRTLDHSIRGPQTSSLAHPLNDEDVDIPEELDEHIEHLVGFLQDSSTIVRYSAAKSLARICERLPVEYTEQVLDTILQLYTLHDSAVQAQEYVPEAESIWHGATLACAEFTRRGLIASSLSDVVRWSSRALLFDIRKGSVSVGSNVRDAAAYVLWAIPRSQEGDAIRPHALSLAQRLVCVSLFDREIHIRRAASAAFQENVGRLSYFPHGIDVLRKIDFYAVSIRRHAFDIAAPQVAEHAEYRDSLLEHLQNITLLHWDPVMRSQAANTVRKICELDLPLLCPPVISRQLKLLSHSDNAVVHGSLLCLAALGAAIRERSTDELEQRRLKIFLGLKTMPVKKFTSFRNDILRSAACAVISSSASANALEDRQGPAWKDILNFALSSTDDLVQGAVADAWASISSLTDCSLHIHRFLSDFGRSAPTSQRGIGRVLGSMRYSSHSDLVETVLRRLADNATPSSPSFLADIEARRESFIALYHITCQPEVVVPLESRKALFKAVVERLQFGLTDYTIDQRGDVGSWIRIECLKGLGAVLRLLMQHAGRLEPLETWLSSTEFDSIVGAILKQGLERLDNVRDEAGNQLALLLRCHHEHIPTDVNVWKFDGEPALSELCTSEDTRSWKDGAWLFPKAVTMLHCQTYRVPILEGLVMSIGSRNEGTLRPSSTAFVGFAASLPVIHDETDAYDLCGLVAELIRLSKRNTSNNTVFIPYLQTFDALMQADVLQTLADVPEGQQILKHLIALVGRNLERLKNVQRIHVTVNIVTSALPITVVASRSAELVSVFLTHSIPKIRSVTAEALYTVSQTNDIFGDDSAEGELLLLETPWLNGNSEHLKIQARRLMDLISKALDM